MRDGGESRVENCVCDPNRVAAKYYKENSPIPRPLSLARIEAPLELDKV